MPNRPPPLLEGTLLDHRFEIREVLGQGDFGITYLAHDLTRGDNCIVRELAPVGSLRDETGLLILDHTGEFASQLLKHRFRLEAKNFMKVSGAGLPLIRAAFAEYGTSFYAREYIPGALSLRERIEQEGRIDAEYAEALLDAITPALHRLHAQGRLHLDLRPSNLLLTPRGGAYLIDPGGSRRWYRDLFGVVEFSPSLPPELKKRGSRIGPATDVFAVAAALYEALAGFAPAPTVPELDEKPLPLEQARPDLSPAFARAIDQALMPEPHERPLTIMAFADLALGRSTSFAVQDWVRVFDEKALALKNLRFDLRECPSCAGVLEKPRPLRLGICPVCHEGSIKLRKIVENLCPNCRMAYLKRVENVEPLSVCPHCTEGFLHRRRKRMLSNEFVYGCDNCEIVFEWKPPMLVVVQPPSGSSLEVGEKLFAAEWRERSGRADEIWHCGGCGAQYDLLSDMRLRQMVPSRTGKFDVLTPEEWFRVASGLPPESGNAECDACGADFYLDGQQVALLETKFDPHHFAERHAGRLVTLDALRWLGVGKEDPQPGYVCSECETELNFDGDKLKLVRSPSSEMLLRLGESHTLEDWHRCARGLPLKGREQEFESGFAAALREDYRSARLPFSSKDPDLHWRGQATRYETHENGIDAVAEGTLEVTSDEWRMGGLLKKWRLPALEISKIEVSEDRLRLETGAGPIFIDLEPTSAVFSLESGHRSVKLEAADLVARLDAPMTGIEPPD